MDVQWKELDDYQTTRVNNKDTMKNWYCDNWRIYCYDNNRFTSNTHYHVHKLLILIHRRTLSTLMICYVKIKNAQVEYWGSFLSVRSCSLSGIVQILHENSTIRFYIHSIISISLISTLRWFGTKLAFYVRFIIMACSLIYYIYEYDKSIILSYYYHCHFNSYYFIS